MLYRKPMQWVSPKKQSLVPIILVLKVVLLSSIRNEDFSFFQPSVTLRPPPLDSETGWTGELWSKKNLLKWPN